MRLKVEINCYEHFSVLGLTKIPFRVENPWFTGEAQQTTYQFEELLGTKLRALYQRKKGRDLFDLYIALQRREVDIEKVLQCYKKYMKFVVEKVPSYKQFVNNMEEKMNDTEFIGDLQALLRPDVGYDANRLIRSFIRPSLIRWKGKETELIYIFPKKLLT